MIEINEIKKRTTPPINQVIHSNVSIKKIGDNLVVNSQNKFNEKKNRPISWRWKKEKY